MELISMKANNKNRIWQQTDTFAIHFYENFVYPQKWPLGGVSLIIYSFLKL